MATVTKERVSRQNAAKARSCVYGETKLTTTKLKENQERMTKRTAFFDPAMFHTTIFA